MGIWLPEYHLPMAGVRKADEFAIVTWATEERWTPTFDPRFATLRLPDR